MKAATAILLHGAAGSPRIWDRVIARLPEGLRAQAPDHHVIAGGPGSGFSLSGPDSGPVVFVGNGAGCIEAALFALVQSFLSTTEIPETAASWLPKYGAAPSKDDPRGFELISIAEYRKRMLSSGVPMHDVAGVVMTGPVGLAGDGHARLNWLSRWWLGGLFLRFAGTTFARRRFLTDQLADPAADPEAAQILVAALRRARHFHWFACRNHPRSLEGFRHLRCPVTVLWGDRDGVLPVTRADEFMTHLPPHAKLEIVEGAGHALPLERPDLVARAIAQLAS